MRIINDSAGTNLAWCRPDDPRYLKIIDKIHDKY